MHLNKENNLWNEEKLKIIPLTKILYLPEATKMIGQKARDIRELGSQISKIAILLFNLYSDHCRIEKSAMMLTVDLRHMKFIEMDGMR